ncbi:MAG: trypsin-like peptidase domain-containing protein [Oscillospiraceae bacterium]|nr:trypsin-like peptidase domain-containing protein [Oscillospiraceae bacterium]
MDFNQKDGKDGEWLPELPPLPPLPTMPSRQAAQTTTFVSQTPPYVPQTPGASPGQYGRPYVPPASAYRPPQSGAPSKAEARLRRSVRALAVSSALLFVCFLATAIFTAALWVRMEEMPPVSVHTAPPPIAVYITPAPAPTYVPSAVSAPPPPSPGETLSAEEVYSKAAPSVVGIISSSYIGGSTGSGMIISGDGYILTNHHVVDGARDITVLLTSGTELEAELIGSDYLTDIAVIKVSAEGLPAIEFGVSGIMRPGTKCYAIGNPLGMDLQNTFTDGMISAVGRDIVLSDDSRGDILMTVLQTNCAVNPGNSGGPLLDQSGKAIGIVSSKIMGDYTAAVEGLSFAIPMDDAIPVINSLMENGYVKGRPQIGITASEDQFDERTAEAYGVPLGVKIGEVDIDSDAYKKGIRVDDIITHVDGKPVKSIAEINKIKNNFKAGDTLPITVYRRGTVIEYEIVLGDMGPPA